MDTDHIRRSFHITRTIIKQMCDKLDSQERKIQIQQHIITQLVQLNRKDRRKSSRRMAA